jgi:hypothetical protein
MNPKQTIPLFLFTLALALYLVPTVAAQEEGNMLTDGLSNIWATLSGYGSQASEYIGSHVPEVAAIGTTGGIATGLGVAYKSASSAKNKLQSAYNGLSGQVEAAQAKAAEATEQLKTQTASITESANKIKTDSTLNDLLKISELTTKLESTTQEKLNLKLINENISKELEKAKNQLEVLTPPKTVVP